MRLYLRFVVAALVMVAAEVWQWQFSSAEAAANHRLRQREFALVANLHAGPMTARLWTTDLSEGYVRINAGYRS